MNNIRLWDAIALDASVMSANAPKSCHYAPLASVWSLAAWAPSALWYMSSTRITSATSLCFHRQSVESVQSVFRSTRSLNSLASGKAPMVGGCGAAMSAKAQESPVVAVLHGSCPAALYFALPWSH